MWCQGKDVCDPAGVIHSRLSQHAKNDRWHVAGGRSYPGAYGIARPTRRRERPYCWPDGCTLTTRCRPRDLLLYRVLGRDQAALLDLVHALLEPLTQSGGGAEPLLQTLETYFATGGVATETARRLHMSVRTVTYRPRATIGAAHGGSRSPTSR